MTARIQRILIIRSSSMGDIVMATPLIKALKQIYPAARISWLVEPTFAPLLTAEPDLEEVLVWPKSQWRQLLRQGRLLRLLVLVRRLAAQLQRRRFDLVIDAQGLFRSRVLAAICGARQRIGIDSREPGKWLMTQITPNARQDPWMSSEYRALVEALGGNGYPFTPRIRITAADRTKARQILSEAGVGNAFGVICPFTTRPQKHWIEARWALLTTRLSEDFDLASVMLGGPNDVAAGQRIMAQDTSRLTNLCGQTRLGLSAAIVAQARLVIGVDTGLTHMGVGFGRPTVCLFGPTRPYLRSDNPRAVVVYDRMHCSPCRRGPTCEGRYTCMRAYDVERVLAAVRRAMD